MNILLVSQCSKKALTETRRILDQFAERRGDRTWQTPITLQGLDTLRRMLKKTARRNTAVACHWIRGLDHSELMWIVGDISQFNELGTVPTNRTGRDVLRQHDENDWHTGDAIKLLAKMAALWHDFGKANIAFQTKINPKHSGKPTADAYRHEWVSLRLFEAFVGKNNDEEWLNRLVALQGDKSELDWVNKNLITDGIVQSGKIAFSPFLQLPPLAKALGWLIVTHHRLPITKDPHIKILKNLPSNIASDWAGARLDADTKDIKACWSFKHQTPLTSTSWRKHASLCASQMLTHLNLLKPPTPWIDNAYVMHIARMALMLADHHYSSLSSDPKLGDSTCLLYANTTFDALGERVLKQRLDEHLIGVALHTRKIMGALPRLSHSLPSIARHKGFRRRATLARFKWQDKAFDVAQAIQRATITQGFFGINMASTGCGKTLANGRIMYALADPAQGARFSIALGLRTLTLQTGEAYRQHLDLGSDDLAVLVGGAAVRDLFEINQSNKEDKEASPLALQGSESLESLLPDNSYVHYDSSLPEGAFSQWLSKSPAAQKLLYAPVLTCTIDHLMPATESTRGGHQIAPMLRLMTSDLVLDEPDDFGIEDLYALSRLVHWAGLLGSRVLLSSATLPPAIVEGLFEAYRAGRQIYNQNRGIPNQVTNICCAWFDEYRSETSSYTDAANFIAAHDQYVQKRLANLSKSQHEVRRTAFIHPLTISSQQSIATEFAANVLPLIQRLHDQNHECGTSASTTDKRVSIGLVRMANIDPIVDVAHALFLQGAPEQYRIHLCVYHSHHPLLVRSGIEARLDRVLSRSKEHAFINQPEVQQALADYPEPNQIWIVLASPVAEVGRDHDYDWGIIEPSSMRSIIQIAGRIRRHRMQPYSAINIALLSHNLKGINSKAGQPAFMRPGFEDKFHLLGSHDLHEILTPAQYQVLNAAPRITERTELLPKANLVDLEHLRLNEVMLGNDVQGIIPAPYFWQTNAHLTGILQDNQRFRNGSPQLLYALIPDEDENPILWLRDPASKSFYNDPKSWVDKKGIANLTTLETGDRISPWGQEDYVTALTNLAEQLELSLEDCARRFGVISLPDEVQGWSYHPVMGYSRRKK
jgi:CRISPR-associated endonuclease/helicase Cas3